MGKVNVSKKKRSPSSASSNRNRRQEGMNKENVSPATTKSGRKVKSPQVDYYDYPAQISSKHRGGGIFGAYFSDAQAILVDPKGKALTRRMITPTKSSCKKQKTKHSPQPVKLSLTPTGQHGVTPGGRHYTKSISISKARSGMNKIKRVFYVEDRGSDDFSRLFAEKFNDARPPNFDVSEKVIKDGKHEECYSLRRGAKCSVTSRDKPSDHFGQANAQYFGLMSNAGKQEAFQFLHAQAVAHGGKGIAYPGTAAMNGMDIVADRLVDFVVNHASIGKVDVTAAQKIENYVVVESIRKIRFADNGNHQTEITVESVGKQFPTRSMVSYVSAYGNPTSMVNAMSLPSSLLTPVKQTPSDASTPDSVCDISTNCNKLFHNTSNTRSSTVCNLGSAFSMAQSSSKK